MIFKKGELTHLWAFYATSFVYGLTSMIMAFMVLYFRDINFSFLQIATIAFSFSFAQFVFEVPTGAFADQYSRKYSTVFGAILSGVGMCIVPLTNSFVIALLGWVIAGIGTTCISGAMESWVVDNLKYLKKKELQKEFFIKSQSISAFGAVFAPFIGAFLVKWYSLSLLWYVLAAGFAVITAILLFATKEYVMPKRKKGNAIYHTFRESKKTFLYITKNRKLLLLLIAGICTTLLYVVNIGWQPFLVDAGLEEHQVGYAYSLLAVGLMVMPFFARLSKKSNPLNYLSHVIIFRMFVLILFLFIPSKLLFFTLLIFLLNRGIPSMGSPVYQEYLHKHIPSKKRATILSVQNMFSTLIYGLMGLLAGFVLDYIDFKITILAFSVFGVIAIYIYQKVKHG